MDWNRKDTCLTNPPGWGCGAFVGLFSPLIITTLEKYMHDKPPGWGRGGCDVALALCTRSLHPAMGFVLIFCLLQKRVANRILKAMLQPLLVVTYASL